MKKGDWGGVKSADTQTKKNVEDESLDIKNAAVR